MKKKIKPKLKKFDNGGRQSIVYTQQANINRRTLPNQYSQLFLNSSVQGYNMGSYGNNLALNFYDKKEPTFQLNQEQQYLPQSEQHLDFDPIGLKKGTYFTRPKQQQEDRQGSVDYFDNRTGRLLKTKQFANGGKYEWSKKDMTKTYPVKGAEYEPYSENIPMPDANQFLRGYPIAADIISMYPPTSGLGYVMGLPTTILDMYQDYKKRR